MNNKFVYLAGAMSCYYKENEIERRQNGEKRQNIILHILQMILSASIQLDSLLSVTIIIQAILNL